MQMKTRVGHLIQKFNNLKICYFRWNRDRNENIYWEQFKILINNSQTEMVNALKINNDIQDDPTGPVI